MKEGLLLDKKSIRVLITDPKKWNWARYSMAQNAPNNTPFQCADQFHSTTEEPNSFENQ